MCQGNSGEKKIRNDPCLQATLSVTWESGLTETEQLAWKKAVYEVVNFILSCMSAVEIYEREKQGCNGK